MTETIPQEKPKRGNKWLRLARKVLIWSVIGYVLNFALEQSGWDTWKKFSKKVDTFTESMLDGALRLSPLNLWNSITTNQYTYKEKRNGSNYFYPSTLERTGKISLKTKVLNWLGYYWYTDSGNAFWFGRLILVLAIIVGIGVASEEYQKSDKSFSAQLMFVLNSVFKFFVFLLALGLVALILYFILKLLVLIVGSVVALIALLKSMGGVISFIIEEIKSEATESSKKSITTMVMPFLSKIRITRPK